MYEQVPHMALDTASTVYIFLSCHLDFKMYTTHPVLFWLLSQHSLLSARKLPLFSG